MCSAPPTVRPPLRSSASRRTRRASSASGSSPTPQSASSSASRRRRASSSAGRAARACAAHQRRQRHYTGAVDAAHAVRRGPRRPGHVPALQRVDPTPCSSARRDRTRSPPRTRTCASSHRPTGTGDLAALDEAHLDAARSAVARRRRVRLRPGPLMDGVRAHYEAAGARRALPQRSVHARRASSAKPATSAARCASERAGIDSRRATGARCSSRPKRPDFTRSSGCRMGICHTCTRSLSCGTVRDAVTGELTSRPRRRRAHLRERPRRRRRNRSLRSP